MISEPTKWIGCVMGNFSAITVPTLFDYSHEVIKWWSRWGRALVPDPAKTFHSFRHSTADKLKQTGIDGFMISELLGHRVENISVGRYGKHYLLPAKRKAMAGTSAPSLHSSSSTRHIAVRTGTAGSYITKSCCRRSGAKRYCSDASRMFWRGRQLPARPRLHRRRENARQRPSKT